MTTASNSIFPGSGLISSIITNIGQGQAIDGMLKKARAMDYMATQGLVACYHERGSDELANRALKDFEHEQLPFKRYAPNAAWYYTMLVGHFLLEFFKEDVSTPVLPIGSYASTVRRRLIDIAGKIVFHGKETVLKVSKAYLESLRLPEFFRRCEEVPIIA